MYEDERGPADPADAFKSGDRVGDNKVSTGEGFLPVDLLGKGDEVVNPGDSSLTGKWVEHHRYSEATLSRASPEISGIGVGLRAPQTDRHA